LWFRLIQTRIADVFACPIVRPAFTVHALERRIREHKAIEPMPLKRFVTHLRKVRV
jgi:hypothetical protein